MNDRKYIIVEEQSCELAILFDEIIPHSKFLKVYDKDNIVSAGFFQIVINGEELSVYAYGKSNTLKKVSRKEDSRLIERVLKNKW